MEVKIIKKEQPITEEELREMAKRLNIRFIKKRQNQVGGLSYLFWSNGKCRIYKILNTTY